MNYADFKKFDTLNGEGIRHSLFVSGCSHKCKGCFNAMAWNPNYGKPFTDETKEMIFEAFETSPVPLNGLSLLGGEPFENKEGLIPFLWEFKDRFPTMDVWCWTGYTFEELFSKVQMEIEEQGWNNAPTLELMTMLDVLVDGKFILEQKNLKLKFRGSENQRIIDVQESLWGYDTDYNEYLLGEVVEILKYKGD